MSKDRTPTPTVNAIGKLGFDGHIIPHTWYEHITYKTDGGTVKVDLQAIVILSDIIYWYRPRQVMDEQTNRVVRRERRFASDKLQRNYKQISDHFGISKTQAKRAVHRLADLGLITMEFRNIKTSQTVLNNVLYLEPIPEAIVLISYPKNDDSLQTELDTPSIQICQEGLAKNVQTNTKTTTETTTEKKKDIFPNSELNDHFPPDPVTEEPTAEDEHRARVLEALRKNEQRGGEGNWADPPAAGGVSDWDGVVDEFVRLTGSPPTEKQRPQWARVFERIGADRGAGPWIVAAAIRQKPDSAIHFKAWTKPHAAESDVDFLVGQHMNGGIKPPSNQRQSTQSDAAGWDAVRAGLEHREETI